MKLLVVGDSHGNIANLKHVMGFAKKIDAKAVIHAGDWNNLKSLETVFECGIPVYTVLGNADINERIANRLQRIEKTNFNKNFLKIKIDGVKIGLIHSIKNLKLIKNYKSKIENLDVIFCGHYHSQKEYEIDGTKIVRPGALENGINFAVFDTDTKSVEFVHE